MRTIYAIVLLLACSGLALAALPATCADPCGLDASSAGFILPVAVITSGSNVTWNALDITHVNADGTGTSTTDTCFRVNYSPGTPTVPVTFTIVNASLQASYPTGVNQTHVATCTEAIALPDGSFALTYYCKLHPEMRGVLVVEPSA